MSRENWRVMATAVDVPEMHYTRDVGEHSYIDATSLVLQAAVRDHPEHVWELDNVRRIVRPLLNPVAAHTPDEHQ